MSRHAIENASATGRKYSLIPPSPPQAPTSSHNRSQAVIMPERDVVRQLTRGARSRCCGSPSCCGSGCGASAPPGSPPPTHLAVTWTFLRCYTLPCPLQGSFGGKSYCASVDAAPSSMIAPHQSHPRSSVLSNRSFHVSKTVRSCCVMTRGEPNIEHVVIARCDVLPIVIKATGVSFGLVR